MRLVRAAWPALILSCGAGLIVAACGDTSGSGVNGGNGANGTGASNGSGAKGSGANGTGARGPDLGSLGGESDGSGVTDPGGDTCAGELIEAKRIPLDMYIMLDVSESMLEPTDGDANVSKWSAVSSALEEFLTDPESVGLGIGLQVFPIIHPDAPATCTSSSQCGTQFGPCILKHCAGYDGFAICEKNAECGFFGPCTPIGECELPDAQGNTYTCQPVGSDACEELGACTAVKTSVCLEPNDCRISTYAAPAAEVDVLPGAEAGLLDVIHDTTPYGGTPTGPALSGAIQHAAEWAKAHPDHQVVTVLATDGLPTKCMPTEIADVAQIAADGRADTPSISTFVIGVFGAEDAEAPANLNTIAKSGGTNEAFIIDTQGNVAMQFRDALNEIRGTRLSCELLVPEADAGKTVDFNQVNVSFDDGSGPADLFYVEEKAGCDAKTGGWYYDTAPASGTPERIIVCPSTCDDFGAADMGSVQIKLGCATRKPVK